MKSNNESTKTLTVTSPVFKNNELMPKKYGLEQKNVNPPLLVEGIPPETKSLVLIMEDPIISSILTWTHWIMWNIPADVKCIVDENSSQGVQGKNSWRKSEYGGPKPAFGTRKYHFKVYALDTELSLDFGARRKDVEKMMKDHVLAEGKLVGLYRRK